MEGSLWTKQTTAEWLPLAKHSLLTATASNYVQDSLLKTKMWSSYPSGPPRSTLQLWVFPSNTVL
eukprot:736556-Amphidinium_carterae.1